MSQTIQRPPVHRIVLVQLGLCAIMALLFLLRSPEAGLSALAGGLISAIPNAYFIYKAFLYSGARQVDHMLRAFYQGGAWKMVLTAIGFAAAFKTIHQLDLFALFGTFVLVQGVSFFASKIAKF